MQIPMKPPELGQVSMETLPRIVSTNLGPCDAKGRYLHWDKLRHLPPPGGLDSDSYWWALKLARRAIFKLLPFHDKDGLPFKYALTDGVMRDILWISENATGAIRADPRITDAPTRQTYLINSLIEEAISSSQVEGAATTRRIAKDMLLTGREPTDHSEKMILNNHRAMLFIKEYRDDDLTPSLVFELHRILTEGTLDPDDSDKAGRLRDAEDDICVYSQDDMLLQLHVPPKADELPDRLQALCDFANRRDGDDDTFIPPIIRGIVIHFMMGYDHPFVDGNGRTARALFYWAMAKEHYWLMEYISISRILKKAMGRYIRAYLYTETDDQDVTYFIVHQLGVIKEAITDLYSYLEAKSRQLRETEAILHDSPLQGALNYRQLALLKHALEYPGAEYTIKSHQTAHGVVYQTARTDLLKLAEDFSVLRRYKFGRKDVFVSPQNLGEIIRRFGGSRDGHRQD